MANFTKKAIKTAFLKLLRNKPISQITVKDIVEECGINRNSFYYHYQDIPALIEAMLEEQINGICVPFEGADPMLTFIGAAMDFAEANRSLTLNVFRYMDRAQFDAQLFKVCAKVAEVYSQRNLFGAEVSSENAKAAAHSLCCECFGFLIDWLSGGMKPDARETAKRMAELRGRAMTIQPQTSGRGNEPDERRTDRTKNDN